MEATISNDVLHNKGLDRVLDTMCRLPGPTCTCGGAVHDIRGRRQCTRCWKDLGPVELACGPSDDDCDSNGRA